MTSDDASLLRTLLSPKRNQNLSRCDRRAAKLQNHSVCCYSDLDAVNELSWCQIGLTSDSEEVTDLPDFTVCLETGAAVKCESTKVKNKAETLKHHVITSCLCLQCEQHEALRLLYVTLFILRINAVSNGQVRGDTYGEGCMGRTGECLSPVRDLLWRSEV